MASTDRQRSARVRPELARAEMERKAKEKKGGRRRKQPAAQV